MKNDFDVEKEIAEIRQEESWNEDEDVEDLDQQIFIETEEMYSEN